MPRSRCIPAAPRRYVTQDDDAPPTLLWLIRSTSRTHPSQTMTSAYPFHVTFDPELDVVVVHSVAPTADASTVGRAMTAIAKSAAWSKSLKVIVDLRPMQFEVAGANLTGVGGMIRLVSCVSGRRVAFVTNLGVQTGLLQVLITGARLESSAHVFDEWPRAVKWLSA